MDIVKQKVKGVKDSIVYGLSMLSPSNIRKKIRECKQKSYGELFVGFFKLFFSLFYYTGYLGVYIIKYLLAREHTRDGFELNFFDAQAILQDFVVVDARTAAREGGRETGR